MKQSQTLLRENLEEQQKQVPTYMEVTQHLVSLYGVERDLQINTTWK